MLRIIAGNLRGRKLQVPALSTTRPTTDRVRESLFNLLTHFISVRGLSFSDLSVLDAYAGSGALGFEAVSREAKCVTFFEKSPQALEVLHQNVQHLKCDLAQVVIKRCDTLHPPKTDTPCDLILLDPPYGQDLLMPSLEALTKTGWCAPSTIIVYECEKRDPLPSNSPVWTVDRLYGNTRVLIGQTISFMPFSNHHMIK
jgi:16S rRNA (guanine966-N2)-methyltransferase